ncbi:MAG TPA: phosphoenolpyruvate carboxylase [Polyangiaceae bacterium]|nr:phosphoenolpyruvate carboxylase [Polyangiaceae bacterium]
MLHQRLVSLRDKERAYEEQVLTRFRLYSGLFLALPFERLQRSAQMLPVFTDHCQRLLKQGEDPTRIVERFFAETRSLDDVDPNDVKFLFLQLIERKIVLFDALEDASFSFTHDLDSPGSLTHLIESASGENRMEELGRLLQRTATRIVLTAHPTQFYPTTVQGIIEDLTRALTDNDTAAVRELLLQLGKTRFTNRNRPTPVEEAERVMDVVADVFYEVLPSIAHRLLLATFGRQDMLDHLPSLPNIQVGFWPGGDRDGNPFVTADTTAEVAHRLKRRLLECYVVTAQELGRRLTFEGAYELVMEILHRLRSTHRDAESGATNASSGVDAQAYATAEELRADLCRLRALVLARHQGLFLEQIDDFLVKVHLFGFYFASIDIRQNSSVFADTLRELTALGACSPALPVAASPTEWPLLALEQLLDGAKAVDDGVTQQLSPLARDTIRSLQLIPTIQRASGRHALHRVVISHTSCPADVMTVLILARLAGLDPENCAIDIVPLFESVDDLDSAVQTMQAVFDSTPYRSHLSGRKDCQTVMVGFSDGTKDGGYLTANLAIRRAKRQLTQLGRERGIELVFFDGRGGPPARGGGNTHRFYRSRDRGIDQWQQQLTIQGQTINTNFGSPNAARHHVEQLFTANLENFLWPSVNEDPPRHAQPLLEELSSLGHQAYRALRDDPILLEFLAEASPLPLFDFLTIASRPVSRKRTKQLELEQLRAIPFVATWSVLKMQVPGYFGLGTALEALLSAGREAELQQLYQESRFFRTLLDNAAMSLLKSRFDVHAYLEHDPRFAALYQKIRDEAERSQRCILRVSKQPRLLANDPINRRSIEAREELTLPLLVIVQAAYQAYLQHERAGTTDSQEAVRARRLSMKGIAAIINATRNAA